MEQSINQGEALILNLYFYNMSKRSKADPPKLIGNGCLHHYLPNEQGVAPIDKSKKAFVSAGDVAHGNRSEGVPHCCVKMHLHALSKDESKCGLAVFHDWDWTVAPPDTISVW